MVKIETERRSEEVNARVDRNLLGFPVLGSLHFLNQTGLFHELRSGGIQINDQARNKFGPDKMKAGVLDFLYAYGHLDEVDGKYVLAQSSLVTEENVLTAGSALSIVGKVEKDMTSLTQEDVDSIPPELRSGLAVSIMDAIQRKLEAKVRKKKGKGSSPSTEALIQKIKSDLTVPEGTTPEMQKEINDKADKKRRQKIVAAAEKLLKDDSHKVVKDLLVGLGLAEAKGKLDGSGDILLTHRVMGSYSRLIASYRSLISNLADAAEHPEKCVFGGEYSRNQETNAIASNLLIMNIINRVRGSLKDEGDTVLDLGSGGGIFSLGLGLKTILFDISGTANRHAVQTYVDAGAYDRLVGVLKGDITDPEALKKAAKYAPNAVTINYIIHDIIGQAPSFEEGVETVKRFLTNYKAAFGSTPLYVTESWSVSPENQKKGKKSYIEGYEFLHMISPQRLISKDLFISILKEAGFKVRNTLVNGSLKVDGGDININETLVIEAEPLRDVTPREGFHRRTRPSSTVPRSHGRIYPPAERKVGERGLRHSLQTRELIGTIQRDIHQARRTTPSSDRDRFSF